MFYVWFKNNSDSERGNPLLLQTWIFYIRHPTIGIAHTTAFVAPVVDHWLEKEIATNRSVYVSIFIFQIRTE